MTAVGLALAFVLAGTVVSPAWIVAGLGVPATPARLTGALLFKVGLVALGVMVAALGWWQRRILVAAPLSRPAAMPSRAALAGLSGVVVIALLLRLYRLEAGLWYDEIVAYVQYARMPFGQLVSTYTSESQHFLFNILAHAAVATLGESASSVRLPAVLFGVGSILALFLFGRRVASTSEALLAAGLMTLSYHHVWFSQNARGYSGLLFFTLLGSWLLLRALDGPRLGPWLAYAAAAALGMYTHVTMLFVVAVHFAVALATVIRRRPDRALAVSMAAAFAVTALLTFQLYALVVPQFVGTIGQHTSVVDWKSPLWTVLELARGIRVGIAGGLVVAIGSLVFLAGLGSFARRAPVLVVLLVTPPVVGAALVLGMGHPLWPRFFFFALGFVLLVVIRGVIVVGGAAGRLLHMPAAIRLRLGTVLASGLIVLSAASVPAAYAPKQDYQGALAFVEQAKEPGDVVVTVGLATFPYRSLFNVDWDAASSAEQLERIRARAQRTWVVYTIPLHLRFEHPDIMAVLERDFSVVKRFSGTLNGGVLVVCRADGGPSRQGREERL
jgi:hypothetical protein